jgi:hypothetical protein
MKSGKTKADFLAGNIKAVDWQQAKKELRARPFK